MPPSPPSRQFNRPSAATISNSRGRATRAAGSRRSATRRDGAATIAAGTGIITYTPDGLAAGTAGTDAFTISDKDALGVVTTTSASFFVDGGALASAPAHASVTEGVATAIAGVSVAETGALASETFTATLIDSYGLLSATGPGVSGDGTTQLVVTGTLAAVNAALATLTDTLDFTTPDTIQVSAVDSLGFAGPSQAISITTPA